MIQFFNSKTRTIQDFNPIQPGRVEMYHCGPTVYAQAHLGNLMPYIHWDVMRRLFESLDYTVVQVMNFTDIGHIVADQDVGNDKMVNALQEQGLELSIENLHQHGQTIARQYLNDFASLNIQRPDHLPFASKHIPEDIEIIQKLVDLQLTYQTDNGIFMDTSKLVNYDAFNVHGDLDPNHVRLSKKIDKQNPRDFALWKFSDPDSKIGWDSPWGLGFPGWHIECSAMSWKYLGESFDIHTGGIEHISIHHTNEIAQSENAFQKPMARYWLHNNHLKLNGAKISKSDGNVVYLDELEARGFHPQDYRYLIMTSHYRSEANFTWDSLRSARVARRNLARFFYDQQIDQVLDVKHSQTNQIYQELVSYLKNDLNSAQAIGEVNKLLHSEHVTVLYDFATRLLGLDFSDLEHLFEPVTNAPAEVKELLRKRAIAKQDSNYEKSDQLRDQITAYGFRIQDTGDVQVLYHAD